MSASHHNDFIHEATVIARHLTRDAIWLGDTCTWVGLEMHETLYGPRTQAVTLGADFYGGTSGIAYFLADSYRTSQEELFKSTALAALRYGIRQEELLRQRSGYGLYGGLAGLMVSCAVCGAILQSDELIDSAVQMHQTIEHESERISAADVISGVSGLILSSLLLSRQLGDTEYLESAIRWGDKLISIGAEVDNCLSWRSGMDGDSLTGYAHGAAGIGASLTELYAVTRLSRFLKACNQAFAFEGLHYDESAKNWKDLRSGKKGSNRGNPPARFAVAWCHGAPGILLSRLRHLQVNDSIPYREQSETAAQTTLHAATSLLKNGNADCSLCHGIAGLSLILNFAGQVLGHPEYGGVAQDLGFQALEYRRRSLCWSTTLSQNEDTPQLMTGMAGIGYWFLVLGQNSGVPGVLHVLQPIQGHSTPMAIRDEGAVPNKATVV